MIGELLDHYRVLELVGRGAMGVVYKGLDVNLDRQVAIKVMSAEARNDPDFVERFRQEARLQGALNHPNVAMLFDYFVHDGTPVAVMEFIDGESLEQMIRRRGAIPARECIPLFKQALRGVAAAHRAGIIHRDLKPSNLMVTRDDDVKVMDFGIAKRQGAPGATKVSSTSIGSPLYMAPEQILGRAVDCRTDVYALGLTLYELVSGHRPFNPRGKAEYMVLNAHVNDLPEPPTVYRYGIPQPIVDAVMRALAKDPDARFQSADEFMSALPDVPATFATEQRADSGDSAVLAPKVGPTGTVALAPRMGPTGTVALAKGAGPTESLAPEYSPPVSEPSVAAREPVGTTVFEYAPTRRLDPRETIVVEYSSAATAVPAATVRIAPPEPPVAAAPDVDFTPPAAAPPQAPEPPSGLMQFLRSHRLAFAVALVATLVLGAQLRYTERLQAMLAGASSAPALPSTQAPVSTEPAAPPPAVASSAAEVAVPETTAPDTASTVAPVAVRPPATTTTAPATAAAPARRDLAGTWRGAYVDGSGKQLLRVVSLSISRVQDDGGIEGTLQYQAASGDGECKLHPRGSSYSAGAQRLQLSPEGCSPHYPKELGVPLDFDGVNPQANTLRNGRIEAPTGAVIRVRLQRVSGV
jgi:eukaryotic-like serine/threonine-protein kinase